MIVAVLSTMMTSCGTCSASQVAEEQGESAGCGIATTWTFSQPADPLDLTQVKYEMLRRVHKDGMPISSVSASFGFSRPAFYKAQEDFSRQGLVGLIPKRRGPKGGYKLTTEILAFIEGLRSREPSLTTPSLVRQIQEQFGVQVHRRSLERALVTAKKKRRTP